MIAEATSGLWLRPHDELARPPTGSAVLWPVYEYTALVFGQRGRTSERLDPFERAVLGASQAGVISIVDQSEVLDLHPSFVGHVQDRLIAAGLLDDYRRPRSTSHEQLADQVQLAVRVYQDPWSGNLWPRYVTDEQRRTVPITPDERPKLVMGTTGTPIDLPAFLPRFTTPSPAEPSSDDVVEALRSWRRIRTDRRSSSPTLPSKPAAKLLPETREAVYLCCPSSRGRPGRPQVLDPFNGPEWSPFFRSLLQQADRHPALHSWLFKSQQSKVTLESDTDDAAGSPETSERGSSLANRLADIADRIQDPLRPAHLAPQDRLDLEALAHDALDELWPSATEVNPSDLLVDPELDLQLITKLARMAGFEDGGIEVSPGLGAVINGSSGPLSERLTAMLLLFPVDRRGVLHELAEAVPDAFSVMATERHGHDVPNEDLRHVVTALISAATVPINVSPQES